MIKFLLFCLLAGTLAIAAPEYRIPAGPIIKPGTAGARPTGESGQLWANSSSGALQFYAFASGWLDLAYLSDTAFTSSWNGVTTIAPSKNAVYDEMILKMTNPMTTLGDWIYGSSGGVPARIAGNVTTTAQTLIQTGDGANSAAPSLINVTSTNTASSIVARDGSGNFSAGTISGALSGNATSATTAAITDDTTTNATMYPVWVTTTTGNLAHKVSSSKMTFNPSTGTLSLGTAASAIGKLTLAGNTSGTVTVAPQATAGTYNFNLPTSAGTSGQVLISQGGTTNPMSWSNIALDFAASQIIRGGAITQGGSSSGETTVLSFATAVSSTGSDITFTARTTTTADKYTINTAGVYAICASLRDAGGTVFGITVNSTGLDTAPQSLTATELVSSATTLAGSNVNTCATVNLAASDVVRLQAEAGLTINAATYVRFVITRVH